MLSKMEAWMDGKKTYLISMAGMLSVTCGFATGEMSFMEFMKSDALRELLAWGGLGSVRAALKK